MELLPLSIGLGLATGLLITELFGLASGGLIVPGYIALHLLEPMPLLSTGAVALATFGIVRILSTFLIIYGRRRTALMILVAYLLGMLIRGWSSFLPADFDVIGFIIPGLIAVWMDRQGVVQTLCAIAIVSAVVRLLLIITVGSELPS